MLKTTMMRSLGISISLSSLIPSASFILRVRRGSATSRRRMTRSALRMSSRFSSKLLMRRGSRSMTNPIVSMKRRVVSWSTKRRWYLLLRVVKGLSLTGFESPVRALKRLVLPAL